MMDALALTTAAPDSTIPVISGCVAFGTTLAFSTLIQKLVGISTATKIIPTPLGVATVCVASLASQRVAMLGEQWVRDPSILTDSKKRNRLLATSPRHDHLQISNDLKIPMHDIRVYVF